MGTFLSVAILFFPGVAEGLTLQEFTRCIGPQGQGPVCQLDAGIYPLSSQLQIGRSNITIKGTIKTSLRDTLLQRAPGWRFSLIIDVGPPQTLPPVTNITIRDLTFDGNRAQNGEIWSSYFAELQINTTKSLLVTNCAFINSPNTGFVVLGRGASGVVVNHSYFGNAVIYGFWSGAAGDNSAETYRTCAGLNVPDNLVVANSQFENIGEPAILGDATNWRIENNIFTNNHSYPAPFNDDGGQIDLTPCTGGAALVGNTFQDGQAASTGHFVQGIEVHANDVAIINNTMRNNTGSGISIGGGANVFVANWEPNTGIFSNRDSGIAIHHDPTAPDAARPVDSIVIDSANIVGNGQWGIWTRSPDLPITHLIVTNSCITRNRTGVQQLSNVGPDVIFQNNRDVNCGPQ